MFLNCLDLQSRSQRKGDKTDDLWNRESCFAKVFQKSKYSTTRRRTGRSELVS